jgi:High-temperature-induced dauer-formation protein
MCIFILQTLSVEVSFGRRLNMKFEAQDTLPTSIRITGFRGSYADYLIIVSLLRFIDCNWDISLIGLSRYIT